MSQRFSDEVLQDRARLLFERYYPAVVRLISRCGFSREEARDMAQDVFVRVCQSMESYRGEGPWAFLETTARRLVFNKIRERKTIKRSADEVSLQSLPFLPESAAQDPWIGQAPPSPEDELIEREESERQSRRLRAAIAELPDKIRRCLLFWLAGLKYSEIQKVEGITMDAVKGRLNEARNLLRARLGEDPEGLDWPEVNPEVDRDQES